jgi:hypothetical protein
VGGYGFGFVWGKSVRAPNSVSLTSEEIIRLLTRSDFLQELHHLLWLPPAERRGHWDMGWNCRDHAFVTGFVAGLFDARSILLQGRAMYTQGPVAEQPAIGIEQAPHAWLCLLPGDHIDVSVRLEEFTWEQVHWPGWPTKVVSASGCVVPGSMQLIHSAKSEEYEREKAIARHVEGGRTAVYLREFKPLQFTKQLLFAGFSVCNSPMTHLLSDSFGQRPDLYARAALHLFDLINGDTDSLAEMEQLRAWEVLASSYEKPFLTVCSKAGWS